MPISYDKNLIFIHVPKTGGSSIEKVLGLHPSQVAKSDCETVLSGGKNQLQHLTLSEIYKLKGNDIKGFTAFGMVREPLSRMKSEYKWRSLSNHPIVNGLTLNGFVEKVYYSWENQERLDSHFTRQSDFYSNDVSFWSDLKIFKFEDGFEAVAEFISKVTGEDVNEVPKINHTNVFKETLSFNNKSIEMMKKMFEPDFEFYN